MVGPRVGGIEISCIAHATEDYDKVLEALLNTVPPHLRDLVRERVLYEDLLGHYKDPIRVYRVRVSGGEALEVLKWILGRMSRSDYELLLLSLEDRFDASSKRVYIRISKQDAYRGEISLGFDDDVIRVVVTVSGIGDVRGLEEFLREVLSRSQ